ncbi:hypothetical protein ACFC26_21875 [Kitasatospora purpeofusca]|uniref:hypothetical protein n=1 Tax=Kitasatospora purpeofusca TaxID=67352 RepID=UPI0035D85398
MKLPSRIHPSGCSCEDCHRPGHSAPLDRADELTIARVLAGQAVNDSGYELTVTTTTTVAPCGSAADGADKVVVECESRRWDVSRHLMAATSFDPPF